MTLRARAHAEAVKDLLELMNIAFMIALFADCSWIVRDMVVNGLTYGLLVIAFALWSGFMLVLYGCVRYHNKQVKEILCKLTKDKLKICKAHAKSKHKAIKKCKKGV